MYVLQHLLLILSSTLGLFTVKFYEAKFNKKNMNGIMLENRNYLPKCCHGPKLATTIINLCFYFFHLTFESQICAESGDD
jgi:hypothetical protein